MFYIDAQTLVNKSIEYEILKAVEEGVFVYRLASSVSEEGWYLEEKDTVIRELMSNESGQQELIKALKDRGFNFTPTDRSLFLKVQRIFQID